MQPALQNTLALAGRILLALLFVIAGFGKIGGFEGAVGAIASKGLPLPQVVAVLTILIELGGGLLLVAGFLTRPTALAVAAFTVLAAFLFHAFWAVPEAQKMMQQINFMKNLSIAGGMLVLAAFGPGAYSVDERRASPAR